MQEILDALRIFIPAGNVAELRVIGARSGNYVQNMAGYYNDLPAMAAEAKRRDGTAPAIYFTLNSCDPRLLARAANRFIRLGKDDPTTADHDITRRLWLPIDCDAKRPKGVSATDAEHAAAIQTAEKIAEYLRGLGWPDPFMGDSGNGGHVCYRIDLPNDKESADLVKGVIEAIGQKFDGNGVDIDRKVFNAARIWKLYGTIAGKGDNLPGQPHRRARVIREGSKEIVTAEMLRKMAVAAQKAPAKTAGNGPGIDVTEFCQKHSLVIGKREPWNDAEKFIINPCPFNQDHREGVIIKHPNGAVSFSCPHNGCRGNDWRALRELLEPKPAREEPMLPPPPPRRIWTPSESFSRGPEIRCRIDPKKDLADMQEELELQMAGKMCSIEMPWRQLTKHSDALRPGCVLVLSGPTKVGKSYLIMNLIRDIQWKDLPWSYLPLEDDRRQWAWRMLAILEGDYSMTSTHPGDAERRALALARRSEEMALYLRNVSENPRAGIKNAAGETIVPEVPYQVVIDWARQAVKKSRVVVIDPHAQIDFNGRDVQRQESALTRELLGLVAGRDCTIILITHLRKAQGSPVEIPVTADDVQGSANLTRLPQTTLVLTAHEMRDAVVHKHGGLHENIQHNRTLTIAAARNAGGTRKKIAFIQSPDQPEFTELGVIDCGKKGRK